MEARARATVGIRTRVRARVIDRARVKTSDGRTIGLRVVPGSVGVS